MASRLSSKKLPTKVILFSTTEIWMDYPQGARSDQLIPEGLT